MMVENNCGEIPIVDRSNHPIGVVTDRDIVCRVVAEGKNPTGQTADSCMTRPVVTVPTDAPLDEVIATMEDYQIRRVPVIDEAAAVPASSRKPTLPPSNLHGKPRSWCPRSHGIWDSPSLRLDESEW